MLGPMHAVLLALLLSPLALAGRDAPPNVADVKLPPAEATEFRFGPGDRISVQVFRHPELTEEIVVAPDGTIAFPLVGRLTVADRTYGDVVGELETGLRAYYTDAAVAVNVVEVTNRKVYVVGEVRTPMVLQVTGKMPIIEALTRTGGINPDARTDNLLVIRGGLTDSNLFTVDVDRLLAGDLAQNVELQPGDIVVVPSKTIVNVERFFRHVQGILAPFVSASQVYRNLNVGNTGGGQVIDDTPPSTP